MYSLVLPSVSSLSWPVGLVSTTNCSIIVYSHGQNTHTCICKVCWWRQSLRFWNELARAPHGSFHKTVLLDNLQDSVRFRVRNFSRSVSICLGSVGCELPTRWDVLPVIDVGKVISNLQSSLCLHAPGVSNPRTAPSSGALTCTYLNWFLPTDGKSRYCFMPVAGGRMKQFLRFRLGCHNLPVAVGRRTNIDRADRVCPHCAGCVGDELHMVYECSYLQPLRLQYAHLFTSDTSTMRLFFGQRDSVGCFNFVLDCLKLLAV